MEGATHTAIFLVSIEILYRVINCNRLNAVSIDFSIFSPSLLYLISYICCLIPVYFNIKKIAFFQSKFIRNLLSFLHAIDGLISLYLGVAIYYKSNLLLFIGLLAITKFFLLHLLSRMVTGQTAYTPIAISIQTTKTYLHHIGSFIFLSNDYTAIITAIWRFVSMNGHAALTLRGKISEELFHDIMWKIVHARNITIVIIFILCQYYPEIRRGFAVSAIGHAAYMIVRLGPVFRLGSIYVNEGEEKRKWQEQSDSKRLIDIFSFRYPYFSLELLLLFALTIYFLLLRITTVVYISSDCKFT